MNVVLWKGTCNRGLTYEKLTTELEELHQKQKAIQSEELLKAIAESTRSYEEILRFIQSASEEEEEIDA